MKTSMHKLQTSCVPSVASDQRSSANFKLQTSNFKLQTSKISARPSIPSTPLRTPIFSLAVTIRSTSRNMVFCPT